MKKPNKKQIKSKAILQKRQIISLSSTSQRVQSFLVPQLTKKVKQKFVNDFYQFSEQFQTVNDILRVKFSSLFTHKQRFQLLKQKQFQLCKDQWVIYLEKQIIEDWIKLFQNMEVVYARKIRINVKQRSPSSLCQELACSLVIPTFNNLIDLQLRLYDLINIEALSFLDAPNLKHLNIQRNQVISFQPLVKMKTRKLENIYIQHNHCSLIDLSRVHFSKSRHINLNCFNQTTFYSLRQKTDSFYDLRPAIKLQCKLNHNRIYSILSNRYSELAYQRMSQTRVQLNERFIKSLKQRSQYLRN